MMDLKEYAHKGIYRQIVMSELSNKHKKRTGTIIGCCKCGRTDKTLYKLNDEERICIDCKKEIKDGD